MPQETPTPQIVRPFSEWEMHDQIFIIMLNGINGEQIKSTAKLNGEITEKTANYFKFIGTGNISLRYSPEWMYYFDGHLAGQVASDYNGTIEIKNSNNNAPLQGYNWIISGKVSVTELIMPIQ